MEKQSLLNYSPEQFKDWCISHQLPSYTAKQVMDWVYHQLEFEFAKMSNLSKSTRQVLETHFDEIPFQSVKAVESKDSLAKKHILTLKDGKPIECVVLREKDYNTLCVSSQSGCGVGCTFCLTGYAGFQRQLSIGEIVGQVLIANQLGDPISHVVFMGMGEPLLNYENVSAAIDRLTAPELLNMSKRKITVSTSGYLAGIKRLIDDKKAINLAFSVGNPNPKKRERIMPCETRNPIREVARLLHNYQQLHNRKLTLEYTLLENENDGQEEAEELANLARYLEAKVNLINLNPHPKIPHRPVSVEKLKKFRDYIKNKGVPVTIRFRKGDDIAAACGQLGESIIYG